MGNTTRSEFRPRKPRCPACQHQNSARAKFCEECGAVLAARCPSCGTQLAPAATGCPECARPTLKTRVAGREPDSASPSSYTPRHLVEKILISKAALEGERKRVSVLFADLKGSMELLADRDPEDARKLLDPVLDLMMEAVHSYEGTVNQVMGDGIMALFGAPLAHEDHAVRACYAALRMQESVRRYANDVRRTEGASIQIRVGVNSGEVVVRSIGSDLRMDYTAVGQTTHLAARMEQMAKPASILITAETFRLAEGYVEVTPLGSVPVKGLSSPVEVYEVVRASSVRSRVHVAAARGLTRLVGREHELGQLSQALDRTRAGHGQLVAVVGEPGVGKSRLYWEFVHSYRTGGALVLESRSVSYGRATTYLPIIDLLRGYFDVESRDEVQMVREKVVGKVLALDKALEPTVPAFLALLDVAGEDPGWHALDPWQRRQRTLDAVKRLLVRESEVQPLVLIFEDLHWIDSETQALLDSLVETLVTLRILLLVNYRPEYHDGWSGRPYYHQLRIEPLRSELTEDLLEATLGHHPTLQPLKRLLVDRTGGNPFFLEEGIRTLVETKALVGERGAYHLARPVESLEISGSVHAVLAARIDRLLLDDRRLLQSAAVVGKDVSYTLLRAIVDVTEAPLRAALSRLQAAEFLYETELFPDLQYTFKHALTHEVAYRSLLHQRRRALHVRIVEAIESAFPDRLTEHVERLADHALKGELWGKALPYMRQAGQKAALRSAHREAVPCFDEALAALSHLPDSREMLEIGIDLRLELRNSLLALGEVEREGVLIKEARDRAEAIGDRKRLSQCLVFESNNLSMAGDHRGAVEAAERSLSISKDLADFWLDIQARYEWAKAWSWLGDYRRAAETHGALVVLIDGQGVRRGGPGIAAVHGRTWLAVNLVELGDFGEALVRAEEAVRIAEAVAYDFSLMHASYVLGLIYARQGNVESAIAPLERSRAISEARGIKLIFRIIISALGSAYALSGRPSEAVRLFKNARESTAGQLLLGEALLASELGTTYLLLGQLANAQDTAYEALEIARRRSERGVEAWVLRLLGEIHSAQESLNIGDAEAAYEAAMDRAMDLGMRPLVAHCHLGLGKLYRRTGKPEQAQEHVTTATAMYREMDMRFWLEKAEAAASET
jgi:class 3 adenylate cyclase/tetratricopeptide (TPR) repeat protein